VYIQNEGEWKVKVLWKERPLTFKVKSLLTVYHGSQLQGIYLCIIHFCSFDSNWMVYEEREHVHDLLQDMASSMEVFVFSSRVSSMCGCAVLVISIQKDSIIQLGRSFFTSRRSEYSLSLHFQINKEKGIL